MAKTRKPRLSLTLVWERDDTFKLEFDLTATRSKKPMRWLFVGSSRDLSGVGDILGRLVALAPDVLSQLAGTDAIDGFDGTIGQAIRVDVAVLAALVDPETGEVRHVDIYSEESPTVIDGSRVVVLLRGYGPSFADAFSEMVNTHLSVFSPHNEQHTLETLGKFIAENRHKVTPSGNMLGALPALHGKSVFSLLDLTSRDDVERALEIGPPR